MARRRSGKRAGEAGVTPNGATVGHEAELWAMADALRGSMDAAEYKHVVLGLIFLKYISDAFEERHAAVLAEFGEDAAEDRDEYTAENIFWVPPEARCSSTHLQGSGRMVDRHPPRADRRRHRPHRRRLPRLARRCRRLRRPAAALLRKSAPLDEVRRHGHVLIDRGSYVGAEPQPDDGRAVRGQDAAARGYEYCRCSSSRGRATGCRHRENLKMLASSTRRGNESSGENAATRCSSRTGAGSTTPAAARRACSCSRSRSSAPTPAATGTAARPGPTSASTARSRTTRRGGSRR